ncbi:MAG: DUF3536 domain-containing protein, partial [Limisphaerales bacterium]
RSLLAECEASAVTLESDVLAYALKGHLDRLSDQFRKSPENPDLLQRFINTANLARVVPFQENLWKPQNTYYDLHATLLPEMRQRARNGDEKAKAWVEKFLALGDQLGFRINGNSG